MISNDATIVQVKQNVLQEVARLTWEGTLAENEDNIPFDLIPGPYATFRCCIYREREIIRQRVRLAKGQSPVGNDNSNIIQVITSACEGCPLSRFTVTDNCRHCMGKACFNSCSFGAITIGHDRARIDADLCRECGKCAKACPYNAIADLIRPCKKSCPVNAITMDENGLCIIDKDKCIHCGQCIHSCPFGAIDSKTSIVDIIELLKSGKTVYAMIAPASEGQFGPNVTMESWRQALKKVGFKDLVEVSLGADMVAKAEAAEWAESYKEGFVKTTSCCPAFVEMVKTHFPKLKDNISKTVSPMVAVSRLIKANDPEAYTVFIGPCISKKSEASDPSIENNADFAVTFSEMVSILKGKGIKMDISEDMDSDGSIYGRRFSQSGGVTNAVLQAMKESGEEIAPKVHLANGGVECKKALLTLQANRLDADFIEGMACEGGCIGGPSCNRTILEARKDRECLLSTSEIKSIEKNLTEHENLCCCEINMTREYE